MVLQGNTGLLSSGVSLTSWEKMLVLVGNSSSCGVVVKAVLGVDVYFY